MSNHESSASLVTSGAVGAFIFGVCTVIFGWRYADAGSLGVMGLAGVFMALSYYFIVEAFRRGPASYIAPFRYSALIWAVVIAFLAWGQTPDPNVLIGAAVLMASGWYLARVPSEETVAKRPNL